MVKGILYGVGVGPGDKELITLKAIRTLKGCDHIIIPKSSEKSDGVAFSIVEDHIDMDKVIELVFPMTSDKKKLEDSWTSAADEISKRLDQGQSVAMITLGDPTIYSTYMYVHKEIEKRGYESEIIPGVTSFCASAARAGISICENSENVVIIPSAYDCDNLEEMIDEFDNIVLMKVARKMEMLGGMLERKGLASNIHTVSRCGFDDEIVMRGIDPEKSKGLSYFTTSIIKKGNR
jgi:precorrin-2/cobalt-factor-2 C20-methyltransferase